MKYFNLKWRNGTNYEEIEKYIQFNNLESK